MKWLDDAPDDWETAPDQPPEQRVSEDLSADVFEEGLLVHEQGSQGAFIYAREGELSTEEYA